MKERWIWNKDVERERSITIIEAHQRVENQKKPPKEKLVSGDMKPN